MGILAVISLRKGSNLLKSHSSNTVVLRVAEAPHKYWVFISISMCFGWAKGHCTKSGETAWCEALCNPCHPKLGSRMMSSDWNWLRGCLSGPSEQRWPFYKSLLLQEPYLLVWGNEGREVIKLFSLRVSGGLTWRKRKCYLRWKDNISKRS